jgi:hypothetical protein
MRGIFLKYVFFLLLASLLVGCSKPKTMEDLFHKTMKTHDDLDDYALVKAVEEDNVIIFTSTSKDGDEYSNEHPKLAFFNKEKDDWVWEKTAVCNLDSWSATTGDGTPYLWCGTLTEPKYEKVLVSESEAKMIDMNDGVKRVWYHLSDNKNEEIKAILVDDTEEWLKEVKN